MFLGDASFLVELDEAYANLRWKTTVTVPSVVGNGVIRMVFGVGRRYQGSESLYEST
jgi:hypothetical protein